MSSFYGCGTTFYGERDFLIDGTWVTTEWLTLFYVPLVPLRSVRIRPAEGGFDLGVIASIPYEQFHERAPHRKQVVCVYLFVLTLGLSFYGALRIAIHANSNGLFFLLFIPVFASLLTVKWWLRKQAMDQAGVAPVREPRWWKDADQGR